jgi:hypothetical protein
MARLARISLAVVMVGLLGVACGDDGGTPIAEQSCQELVKTYRDVKNRLSPEQSFDTWAQADRDARALKARVAALGGCPNQPSLSR